MTAEFELVALDEPNPWDRRNSEDSDAFHAFTSYRNTGPKRTYAAVAREFGISPGHVSKWAVDFAWKERAAAWDFYQDRIFQAEIAESQRTIAKKQANFADRALKALNAPIEALLTRLEEDPETVMAEFGAKDIMKLMKTVQDSAKIFPALMGSERLAIGQPTEITERNETHNVNYNDTQRIGEVLDVLKDAGVLDAFLAGGGSGEIIDTTAVEVDDDRSDAKTDRIPASTE